MSSRPYAWLTRAASRLSFTAAPADAGEPAGPAAAASAPQAVVILDDHRLVVDAGSGVERVLGRSRDEVIGRRIDLVPSLGGRGHLESPWPDGSVHLLEFCATAAPPSATQLVALRDVTEHPSAAAYAAPRDPRHAAAADLCADAEDVAKVLDHAAIRVAAALGVELAGIFEDLGPRRRMVLRAGAGWTPGAVGEATVSSAEASPVGWALVAREPVIIADLGRAELPARPSWLLYEHGVISGVETVIGGPGRPWGVLGAYARRARSFTPDDVDFVRCVATALALAVQRAQLEATAAVERRQAVDEAERRTRARITQLLHDEALQSLLAARQHLNVAVHRPERHDCVVRAREGVHRAIRELRGAVGALHPVAIESSRLRDAIQAIAGHQARQGGFGVSFELAVEPGDDCAPLLLSVIRELTANIAQHAGAREVRVVLRADGDDLVLEVCDDGVGIAPGRLDAALAEGHIGLASVTRRVRALGGALEVAASGLGGTCVRITLPGRVPAALEAGTGLTRASKR